MSARVLAIGVLGGALAVGVATSALAATVWSPASVGEKRDGAAASALAVAASAEVARCGDDFLRTMVTGSADGELGARPDDAAGRLFHDRLSGVITPEEHARYGVYRRFDPAAVPAEYQLSAAELEASSGTGDLLTGPMLVAYMEMDCLAPEVQDELAPYFDQVAPAS